MRIEDDTKKRAVFVLSPKGGPGKTTFSRGYLDLARAAGLKVAAYDCDGSVGQLVQFYGKRDSAGKLLIEQDALDGVGFFDIRDDKQRDMIVNALEGAVAAGADTLLYDMPGGAVGELGKVFSGGADSLFDVVRRHGYTPTAVIVITPALKSAQNVKTVLSALGAGVSYVVVKNLFFSESIYFKHYDGKEDPTGTRKPSLGKQALESAGGHEIAMPPLNRDDYWDLDAGSLGFTVATKSADLTLAQRERVTDWLRRMKAALASADLLPAEDAAAERQIVHAGMDEEA